jgi:hypothetical protein
MRYVEIDQQHALNYMLLLLNVVAPTCFGNNYAILREQLSSF